MNCGCEGAGGWGLCGLEGRLGIVEGEILGFRERER